MEGGSSQAGRTEAQGSGGQQGGGLGPGYGGKDQQQQLVMRQHPDGQQPTNRAGPCHSLFMCCVGKMVNLPLTPISYFYRVRWRVESKSSDRVTHFIHT